MPKVLHIYKTYFPDPPGGVQEVIRSICSCTSPYGYSHTVLTVSDIAHPEKIEFEGVQVYREKTWFDLFSCPISGPRLFFTMSQLSKKHDILVYHYPWPFGDLLSFVSDPKPTIVLYHSDIVKQKLSGICYAPLRNVFLANSDVIVATSKNYLRSSKILKKYLNKTCVIPLAATPDPQSPNLAILFKHNLMNKPYVLFLGALRYYKGLQYLIRAAKKIQVPVIIAGDGGYKNQLEKLKAECAVKNVIFLGRVSNAEKKALLMNCSVFVFPSHLRSEAYGVALAEAAMYGKPMVSCDIGTGTSYVNVDGITGYVVKPQDSEALSTAINHILTSPLLSAEMSHQARARWQSYMSPEVFGISWNKLFFKLLTHG